MSAESIHLVTGDQPVPTDAMPVRASLTVNCLLPVRSNDTTALVLHDADPANWRQWFPPYTFYHTSVQRPVQSRADLENYLRNESEIRSSFDKSAIRADLSAHIQKLLSLTSIELTPEPVVPPDYWVKWSRSQHVWTAYCFVFYRVASAGPRSRLHPADNSALTIAPLDATAHEGKPIVENLVELLRDRAVREVLESHAIAI